MLTSIFRWLTGGVLDRVLDTVDKKISAETDREAIKGEILREYYRNKADFMRAGGFWLMLIFAIPLACWWASVIFYSIFLCANCAFPQTFTIAALPAPLDEWSWLIVVSIFGVIGADRWGRK